MKPVPQATSLRRAPVQRRSAERLTRILDACADLLGEVGYDALSTRAVALRAGVPIGSVYRFFGNKRAMADALAQRNLERYTERVTGRLQEAGEGGWRAAMDAVLDEYLAMKRTAPGFTLVDFGNQIPVGSRDAGPNHRVADRLTDLLSGYLDREPDEDLRRTFLVAVETADTLVHLAFRVAPEGDEKIIGEARELLRAYLARVLDPRVDQRMPGEQVSGERMPGEPVSDKRMPNERMPNERVPD
jgi:AcrR family transcriptional regulator